MPQYTEISLACQSKLLYLLNKTIHEPREGFVWMRFIAGAYVAYWKFRIQWFRTSWVAQFGQLLVASHSLTHLGAILIFNWRGVLLYRGLLLVIALSLHWMHIYQSFIILLVEPAVCIRNRIRTRLRPHLEGGVLFHVAWILVNLGLFSCQFDWAAIDFES